MSDRVLIKNFGGTGEGFWIDPNQTHFYDPQGVFGKAGWGKIREGTNIFTYAHTDSYHTLKAQFDQQDAAKAAKEAEQKAEDAKVKAEAEAKKAVVQAGNASSPTNRPGAGGTGSSSSASFSGGGKVGAWKAPNLSNQFFTQSSLATTDNQTTAQMPKNNSFDNNYNQSKFSAKRMAGDVFTAGGAPQSKDKEQPKKSTRFF